MILHVFDIVAEKSIHFNHLLLEQILYQFYYFLHSLVNLETLVYSSLDVARPSHQIGFSRGRERCGQRPHVLLAQKPQIRRAQTLIQKV